MSRQIHRREGPSTSGMGPSPAGITGRQGRWGFPPEIWLHFGVPTGLAVLFYALAAAPDLTWAHHGADGGELLAAAVSNGVPHPPGYPLYILLLQGWLAVGQGLCPGCGLAWLGNLLSAVCAGLSVGVTVVTVRQLLAERSDGSWLAWVAGGAWAISPLLWSQAVITEVYGLHALLMALLGWATLTGHHRARYLIPLVALGVAHHLTFLLLLPAALYGWWRFRPGESAPGVSLQVLVMGGLLGALLYLRIPLAAGAAGGPPPVNWGYADNWSGFWWLVSGAAYRSYLLDMPLSGLLGRLATWAYTLTSQFTPLGLALALVGLAQWDQRWPEGRTFGLLWMLPVSLYAMAYNTVDSDIYLLPVIWLEAIWLARGLAVAIDWVNNRAEKTGYLRRLPGRAASWLVGLCLAGLVALAGVRWPALALRQDWAAVYYLHQVQAVLTPQSLVISNGDAETFALWYGAWASGELLQNAPDVVLVNYALYQYPWYRRLLQDLYPDVPALGQSWDTLLTANRPIRAIYFSEPLPIVPEDTLAARGPLWWDVTSRAE